MEYSPFITNASRTITAADRMEVFGPGTDPAGLGTLGAPVNPEHVFEYLGENLPPFGSPQDVLRPQAVRWNNEFADVYGGKIVKVEQDRFSPNTSRVTVTDPEPLVMRDEIGSIRNNAQIMREKVARSDRSYPYRPAADALAMHVSADSELRDLQAQAVALVHESQMDVIRATHEGARARGAALRGENIGALPAVPPIKAPNLKPAQTKALLKWLQAVQAAAVKAQKAQAAKKAGQKSMLVNPADAHAAAGGAGMGGSSATDTGAPVMDEVVVDEGGAMSSSSDNFYIDDTSAPMATALETRFDPSKIALILLGVTGVAGVAYFATRKR